MANRLLTVVARLKAKEGQEQRLREELMKLVEPTHAEQGCIQYDLHESNEEKGLFLFYENWTDAQALERHLRSPHINHLRSQESTLLAQPVEITLWTRV